MNASAVAAAPRAIPTALVLGAPLSRMGSALGTRIR